MQIRQINKLYHKLYIRENIEQHHIQIQNNSTTRIIQTIEIDRKRESESNLNKNKIITKVVSKAKCRQPKNKPLPRTSKTRRSYT